MNLFVGSQIEKINQFLELLIRQINVENKGIHKMNDLYKVVHIEGKNLGCVALKDIKSGTLILQEKSQCVVKPGKYDTDDFKTGFSLCVVDILCNCAQVIEVWNVCTSRK